MRYWLVQARGDMSQSKLAELAGIKQNTYSNIESGKRNPSVKVAKSIASVLGFNWTKFFE